MSEKIVRVGVLALQGAFIEHQQALQKAYKELKNFPCRLEILEVRRITDLESLDGLIIPGGESTTMGKFLGDDDMLKDIKRWIKGNGHGVPVVWGICAGAIMLANEVLEPKKDGQLAIGGLAITVTRNAYGRQRESFESELTVNSETGLRGGPFTGIFIRAPGITSVDKDDVTILASYGSSTVAVQQGNLLATTFHPELTEDTRWHQYFLNSITSRHQ